MKKNHFLFPLAAIGVGAAAYLLSSAPDPSTARSESEQPEPSIAAAEVQDGGVMSTAASAEAPALPAAEHPEGCPCPLHATEAAARPADSIMALPEPLAFLNSIVCGSHKTATIPLPGGRLITGDITLTQNNEDGLWLVQGTIEKPKNGRFMFMRQTIQGVAGDMVGFVLYDENDIGYKVVPEGVNGAPLLAQVSVHEIICRGLPAQPVEEIEEPYYLPQAHPRNYPIPPEENNIIQLQSLPEADGVIYLDFDGEEQDFVGWGYINALPAGVSNGEIFRVWQGVSEDFAPFNLNVTTVRSVYDNAPLGQRIHVVITPTNTAAPGAGGVAFLDSFNWDSNPVCWSFYVSGKDAVEVISHEIGHTLGLLHHGRIEPPEEYYQGASGWAPIMGVCYFQPVTHWSKGEYPSANNSAQDDLLVITTQNNGVAYREDDHGETFDTSSYLEIFSNNRVDSEGIIEISTDRDAFRFRTTGGSVNLDISPVNFVPNLNIGVQLRRADGSIVTTGGSPTALSASIRNFNVPAGDYFLLVQSTGRGNPATGGYSSYGSLGAYSITGTVGGAVLPNRFAIDENSPNGTFVGKVNPRVNHGGGVLNYSIISGNAGGGFTIDSATGDITVANSSILDYEALSTRWEVPANIEFYVRITNSANSVTEEIRTVINVRDVNEPPVFSPIAPIRIPENTMLGTVVGKVEAIDPDRYDFPDYAIAGGNFGGAFNINRFGEITVSGALVHSIQPSYSLVVQATDQGSPKTSSTATVPIEIVPMNGNFAAGSIMRYDYSSITGTTVTSLTDSAKFPADFDTKRPMPSFDAGADRGNQYGSTMRGYLVAPATGEFTFWISSTDASELHLSSDTDLDNTTMIASFAGASDRYEWDETPTQRSATISLTQGDVYYIESRHKAGIGLDHLAVAWSGPGIDREIIPGTWLSPYDADGVTTVFISSPNSEFVDVAANTNLFLESVAFGPNGALPTVEWTQLEGPAPVVFGSPDERKTTATFPADGRYVVQVTATVEENTASAQLIVRAGNATGVGLTHVMYGKDTQGGYQTNNQNGYTIIGSSIGIPLIDRDDGFQMLGQVFQGDFDIITRVAGGSNVAANHERLGLVVRQGLEPISNGVSAYIGYRTSTNWGHFIRRAGQGEANRQNSYENTGVPGFVRLNRIGNTVRAYHSYNGGQTWMNRGAINIPGPVRAGLCWSSSNKNQVGSANFDSLQGFSPTNRAPVVDAGGDRTAEVGETITLNGAATDDGLPADGGGLTYNWSRVSGPGGIVITDPTSPVTDVTCDTAGVHQLRLTVNDGGVASFADITLTVAPVPSALAFSAPQLTGISITPGSEFEGGSLADFIQGGFQTTSTDGAAYAPQPLVFSKISGPAWLQISPNGELTGSPRLADRGENTFVVRVADSSGQSDEATLHIDVNLTPWQDWTVAEFGLDAADDPEIAGALVDADKDGHVNLLEYALATDPQTPDTPSMTHEVVKIDGGAFLRLSVVRNPEAVDLAYVIQVTSTPEDPDSWTAEGTVIEVDTENLLRARDTVGGPSRFIHLQVNLTP